MSNQIKDTGGAAFPRPFASGKYIKNSLGDTEYASFPPQDGMTLRDYFVANVSPEIVRVMGFEGLENYQMLSKNTAQEWLNDIKQKSAIVADISGIIANAMIAERNRE